jgi:ABC-type glycerol-3-phosphate transport system permease component
MEASGGVVTPGTDVRQKEKEREEARAAEGRGPRRNWLRPVLMWLAVIAIIIFCLFPFYWLVNVSLKTGSDLSQSDLLPPSPTPTTTRRCSRTATSPRRSETA